MLLKDEKTFPFLLSAMAFFQSCLSCTVLAARDHLLLKRHRSFVLLLLPLSQLILQACGNDREWKERVDRLLCQRFRREVVIIDRETNVFIKFALTRSVALSDSGTNGLMFHSCDKYRLCDTVPWSCVNDQFCRFSLFTQGTDWPRIVNINHSETLQTNRHYVLLSHYLR